MLLINQNKAKMEEGQIFMKNLHPQIEDRTHKFTKAISRIIPNLIGKWKQFIDSNSRMQSP